MSEPRTFRARLVLLEIRRPLSVREIGPLIPATTKQAATALESLIRTNLVRRVHSPGCTRYLYEAIAP